MLLAQIGSGPLDGWMTSLAQLGSFGVLVYMIVYGLPSALREIKAERKDERSDYIKAINAERADFTAALAASNADRKAERSDLTNAIKVITDFCKAEVESIRVSAKAEMDTMRALFQQEQRETRAHYASESESLRKMYFETVNAMRTAVHDVRDVASATVNKANVAIEVVKPGTLPRA